MAEEVINVLERQSANEWLEFRRANDFKKVRIADVKLCQLNLTKFNFKNTDFEFVEFVHCQLNSVRFEDSELREVAFENCTLEGSELIGVISNSLRLDSKTTLCECPQVTRCTFVGLRATDCSITDCVFDTCVFANTEISSSSLSLSRFSNCEFRASTMKECSLHDAIFTDCRMTEGACFTRCLFNKNSHFPGTPYRHVVSDPIARLLLSRNEREWFWSHYYKQRPIRSLPIRCLWFISDYGTSGARLALIQTLLVICFSQAYLAPYYVSRIDCCSIDDVDKRLPVLKEFVDDETNWIDAEVRAIYFSVVVTTTLGFGEIHPHPSSISAQVLVASQTVLGYLLLVCIVTRIAMVMQDHV